MYKTIDCPTCEKNIFLRDWRVNYDKVLESEQLSNRIF